MVDPNDPRALRLAELDREIAAGRPKPKSGRQKMGNEIEVGLEDLPPLARKYVEENEGMRLSDAGSAGDGDLGARMDRMEGKMDADERGLRAERDARIAGEVDEKATRLMNSDPSLDYSGAVRLALSHDEDLARADEPAAPRRVGEVHGTDEEMRGAAERRMRQDPENYATDEDETEPVGSTHDMADDDYQRQMKEAMERRGYDVG